MPAPFYVRASGEYVRPAETFRLDSVCDEHARWVPAAGVTFHQRALAGYRDGQDVTVELVPETGNPHDNRAVALDVDGQRCGYVYADSAPWYHDVVRAKNRSGAAVVTAGKVRHETSDDEEPVILLHWRRPNLDALLDLAEGAGLREAHDRVWSRLTPEQQKEALAECWEEFSRSTCRALRASAELAPELTWSSTGSGKLAERVPAWHYSFARDDVLMARERAREERARAYMERQAAKAEQKRAAAEMRAAAAAERRAIERTATDLCRRGELTYAQIAEQTGLPRSTVERLARAARNSEGIPSNRWHDDAVAGRIERALRAAVLQETGLSRREIANELGCGAESVKQLLADGKFYCAPEAYPSRLGTARSAAHLLAQGATKDEVGARLGLSPPALVRACRDAYAVAGSSVPMGAEAQAERGTP